MKYFIKENAHYILNLLLLLYLVYIYFFLLIFARVSHSSVSLPILGFYDFSVDLFCVAKIRRADGTERDGQSLQRCCCLYLCFVFFFFCAFLYVCRCRRATFRATIKGKLDTPLPRSLPRLQLTSLPHP